MTETLYLHNNKSVNRLLQEDIEHVYYWWTVNEMDHSLKKCKVMSFARKIILLNTCIT